LTSQPFPSSGPPFLTALPLVLSPSLRQPISGRDIPLTLWRSLSRRAAVLYFE
jgi:hypothetical protein